MITRDELCFLKTKFQKIEKIFREMADFFKSSLKNSERLALIGQLNAKTVWEGNCRIWVAGIEREGYGFLLRVGIFIPSVIIGCLISFITVPVRLIYELVA